MAEGLTCTESEELLALAALGQLTRAEGAPLDEHLRGCRQCRLTATAYLQATDAMTSSLDTPEPPPSLRRNLMREVYAARAHGELPESTWAPLRRALTSRRVFETGAALVTVAAVIVAVVALVTRPAPSDVQTYSIVGTTTAPAVQGTLTYDAHAQQAVMTLSGLPDPTTPGGSVPRVYEVWLVSGSGATDGVAFLSQSPLDRTWSTVIHGDLSSYSAVAATAEPYGGSPKPTSAELLSVQLTR